jgi:hypothetical protein
MLKEYILEAVSLLADVVLGPSTKALANCHPCGSFWGYGYSNCFACGADKKVRYKIYQCGQDYHWCYETCVYC